MDSIVDRIADVLENVQGQLDTLSREIFAEQPSEGGKRAPKADLQQIVKHLGRSNSLLSKLNESLLSISRPLGYFRQGGNAWVSEEARLGMKSVERDVRSLGEYLSKMSSEITFLLEATLGLINIEQNSIIKVFSIAAVLFLPPTLVGTVYGMNFQHMPELLWPVGYPMALVLMVVSAILPYLWFKFKGWL
ncbi:Magnesium transport protein CorA [compost metagenome]